MHVHQSLWKGGKPLFSGSGTRACPKWRLCAIGGVARHVPRSAITNPTTN